MCPVGYADAHLKIDLHTARQQLANTHPPLDHSPARQGDRVLKAALRAQ